MTNPKEVIKSARPKHQNETKQLQLVVCVFYSNGRHASLRLSRVQSMRLASRGLRFRPYTARADLCRVREEIKLIP